MLDRDAIKAYVHRMIEEDVARLGEEGLAQLLDRGRELSKRFELAEVLREGGTVLFPHAALPDCGHQIAAAIHACLDSGAERVLAVGVLHALTDELEAARVRVAEGGDPADETSWGIQGPGLEGHEHWWEEFSLQPFKILWDLELDRRGLSDSGPRLIERYPYLAGGHPEHLPGIEELQTLVEQPGTVVVTTADPFHHGIGYGDPPTEALSPEQGGLDLARRRIEEGLALLEAGRYRAFNQHCVRAKSDGRDAGQVARYLLGPLQGRIRDLTYTDTTAMYGAPPPTWVAAALVELRLGRPRS
jgi:hypothetical protein